MSNTLANSIWFLPSLWHLTIISLTSVPISFCFGAMFSKADDKNTTFDIIVYIKVHVQIDLLTCSWHTCTLYFYNMKDKGNNSAQTAINKVMYNYVPWLYIISQYASLFSVDLSQMHLRSKFKDSSPCGYFESELSAADGYIFYVSQSRNTGHSLKTDPCGCYSGTEL